MAVEYLRHTYLDASTAAKRVIDEPGPEHILKYFDSNSQFYMTSLCFAEALGVLKRKASKKQISRDEYFDACFDLMSFLRLRRFKWVKDEELRG